MYKQIKLFNNNTWWNLIADYLFDKSQWHLLFKLISSLWKRHSNRPEAKQFAIEVPRNRISCPSNRSKQSQETDSLYRRHTICAAKFEWQVVVCKSIYVAFHSNFTAYIVCWRYIHDISYVSFLFCFCFVFTFVCLFVCLFVFCFVLLCFVLFCFVLFCCFCFWIYLEPIALGN